MVGANQYVPLLHDLPGAAKHVERVERWLRGEIDIPEIAGKWTTGPVVRMEIAAPPVVTPGEQASFQVLLTNNKTGHDFPTGPLDMIESWIELLVTLDDGRVVQCFVEYLGQSGLRVSRAEFEANLAAKLADPAFTRDVAPLLGPGVAWDVEGAARYVREELLAHLSGSPWKGAESEP